jgi:hypothetical protein
MRIAFTIIYNGLHHMQHKGWAEFMVANFDHWVVVEGHSRPNGSTRWCKKLSIPARSTDGTHEYLMELASNTPHLHYLSPNRYWLSKDHQVNQALELARHYTQHAYLWEVDADEHWRAEDLSAAEQYADDSAATGFGFQFNHYVGPNLIALGEWGSGVLNRLWKWDGQPMRSHEPALLMGQRRTELVPDIKFDHYSYYFEQDVKFKSMYYKGHEAVYSKWLELQSGSNTYPMHISSLFGLNTQIGKTKSYIHEITNT